MKMKAVRSHLPDCTVSRQLLSLTGQQREKTFGLSRRRGLLLEAEHDCLTEQQIAPCKNTCGHARAAAYQM